MTLPRAHSRAQRTHVLASRPRLRCADRQRCSSSTSESRRLVRGEALPNVAFVLDAERNRSVPNRPVTDRRADNRYRLGQADLPDLAALRARGIRRVLKLVPM